MAALAAAAAAAAVQQGIPNGDRLTLAGGARVAVPPAGNWTRWPSAPPRGCPFPPSQHLQGYEYLSGANAQYGGADTWYPTWAADGRLYTPFTDGTVDGVRAGSGSGARQDYRSTTGHAVVDGADPFSLNLSAVGTTQSETWPYLGRYPCGSLHHNGTWFYGTYFLLNPNVSVRFPDGSVQHSGPNPGPNCHNWCVQGPMVSLRTSRDGGTTWDEPRHNATGRRDNLFGEDAFENGLVKFGAPHFVDFGRDLEHSPDGMAYIVGHGRTSAANVHAWMLGDAAFLARVRPGPAAVNDRSQWEFYAGGTGAGARWVRGDVTAARPVAEWERRMGVVTMTYFAPLRKYILTVSTATGYPNMEGPFDTYFLESDDITGPWSLVSYNAQFGPEAYFVNWLSKFLRWMSCTAPASPRRVCPEERTSASRCASRARSQQRRRAKPGHRKERPAF
eukprot:TRINITY_DN9424_c0_g1_i3.p1 TRINITY_DN9424_c0_g1~~TRINITY_DN9424_c0_g1_i3.p1  ORF type:complete len:473 (+),score=83.44 TRINITY_DN9424_c0_g1_i3:79-1419(+)